jgi:hypothetical protein
MSNMNLKLLESKGKIIYTVDPLHGFNKPQIENI